jgi:hypothetical protein
VQVQELAYVPLVQVQVQVQELAYVPLVQVQVLELAYVPLVLVLVLHEHHDLKAEALKPQYYVHVLLLSQNQKHFPNDIPYVVYLILLTKRVLLQSSFQHPT